MDRIGYHYHTASAIIYTTGETLQHLLIIQNIMMELKAMTLDHDFYVVVGKQCRTENAYTGN